MLNTILIGVSIVALIILLIYSYSKNKNQALAVSRPDYDSFEKVVEVVKQEMVALVTEDYSISLTEEEFNAAYKRRARNEDALKMCVYGVDSAKAAVIELIRSFIADAIPISSIDALLGLVDGQEPSDHVKFEIIMYRYKKKHGKGALTQWIKKNGFDRPRASDAADARAGFDMAYYVTVDDLHISYIEEDIHLTKDERIDVMAILVYQMYKGFGVVDTLREMDINGFNMGTSGTILSNVEKQKSGCLRATNAVWVYFEGKYIHFRFFNFGSEDELRRIVQLLVRWNNPGPLTAKRGYLVNTMYDRSRILALRPPASEYWAVFVRKFSLSDVSPEALIIKEYTHRGDLAIKLIEFLMRGQVTCGVTGRQGSGKTTLMSSILRYIDPRYTVRILEMAPELYLRELYPSRNILSVQETNTVTAAELQDALKKSDAAVSIVGEVATDGIAARMIQMGQVASLFTVFSHHANTAKDLVFALRNSLVNAGNFSNMSTAEKQVTDVVHIDIHLDYTPDGRRYIERISEIVALQEGTPYPDIDEGNLELSRIKLEKEYYERTTDRVSFQTHDLLRYDLDTNTYYVVDRISPALEHFMRSKMTPVMRDEYDRYIWANWGARSADVPGMDDGTVDEVAEAIASMPDVEVSVSESAFAGVSTGGVDTGDDSEMTGNIVPIIDDFTSMFDFFGESSEEYR